MRIDELYVGQSSSLSKRFTLEDVKAFARLSQDNNPVHLDKEYAENSVFHQRIVHGFLTGSLLSAIIGTQLPGNGSIYLGQTLNFRKPVYHDQLITATVTVMEIRKDKPIVKLSTVCKNEQDEVVIDGEAIVKLI
ncbi:MAG: MaoC family dehydratase [bacterium]|nr:MaoC family dehydratase [Candidatus Limimorpha caballi]